MPALVTLPPTASTDEIMAAIHALSGQELAGTYNEAPAQNTIEKIKQALHELIDGLTPPRAKD